jgi:hypothetical protein
MSSNATHTWSVKTKATAGYLLSFVTHTFTYELIRYTYLVSEDEGAGWVLVVYRARRTCIRELTRYA